MTLESNAILLWNILTLILICFHVSVIHMVKFTLFGQKRAHFERRASTQRHVFPQAVIETNS